MFYPPPPLEIECKSKVTISTIFFHIGICEKVYDFPHIPVHTKGTRQILHCCASSLDKWPPYFRLDLKKDVRKIASNWKISEAFTDPLLHSANYLVRIRDFVSKYDQLKRSRVNIFQNIVNADYNSQSRTLLLLLITYCYETEFYA